MNTHPIHLHYPPEADPDTAPAPAPALVVPPAPVLVSPDAPMPPLDAPMPLWYVAARWMITKGLLLVLLLASLALAVYAVFIDRDHSSANDSPSASSSINGAIEARTSGNANAVDYATAPAAAHSSNDNAAPLVTVPAPALHPGDVASDLQAARADLQSANLVALKAALDDIFATQPDNADARALQQQLVQHQQRRDAAMQVAIACAKDQLWGCVRNNAQEALAADSSNRISQALLEQAILASGWSNSSAKPATSAAPAQQTAATTDTTNVEAAERAIEASGWRNPPLPPDAGAVLGNSAAKTH